MVNIDTKVGTYDRILIILNVEITFMSTSSDWFNITKVC